MLVKIAAIFFPIDLLLLYVLFVIDAWIDVSNTSQPFANGMILYLLLDGLCNLQRKQNWPLWPKEIGNAGHSCHGPEAGNGGLGSEGATRTAETQQQVRWATLNWWANWLIDVGCLTCLCTCPIQSRLNLDLLEILRTNIGSNLPIRCRESATVHDGVVCNVSYVFREGSSEKQIGTPSCNIRVGLTLPCLPRLPAEAKAWPNQLAEVYAQISMILYWCFCVCDCWSYCWSGFILLELSPW